MLTLAVCVVLKVTNGADFALSARFRTKRPLEKGGQSLVDSWDAILQSAARSQLRTNIWLVLWSKTLGRTCPKFGLKLDQGYGRHSSPPNLTMSISCQTWPSH